MKRWMKVGGTVAGGLAASAATAAVGALLWNRETARAAGQLIAPPAPNGVAPARYSRDQLEGLPAPVARYFDFALTPGQRLVRRAHFRQAGDFSTRPGSWSRFTAEQDFSVRPPGFVWDATIRMVPLAPVRVRDSYLAGEGAMYARAAALVTVANQRGTPEIASGALMRYLAESVWLPTALLPTEGVSWEAIDDSTARATLADGSTTVSVDVHFGVAGEVVRVSAMRYRDVKGRPVLTPWEVQLRDYARVGGMMIPQAGEVAWLLPEGPQPYWRGRVVDARYELAP
jgi:hypothetical protein